MRVAPLLRLTASHVRTARSSMHQAARTVTCVDYRCDTPSNAPNDLCESFHGHHLPTMLSASTQDSFMHAGLQAMWPWRRRQQQ